MPIKSHVMIKRQDIPAFCVSGGSEIIFADFLILGIFSLNFLNAKNASGA
jgi:hypothetical protein